MHQESCDNDNDDDKYHNRALNSSEGALLYSLKSEFVSGSSEICGSRQGNYLHTSHICLPANVQTNM